MNIHRITVFWPYLMIKQREDLHLCHEHLHLRIVLILKFVFSQPESSCQECIVTSRGAESSVVCGKRPIFSISLGENIVPDWSCSIYNKCHENKLFLWHSWLGHLVGKTGEWEAREGNGKRTECAGMCMYVQESGRRREWKNQEGIKSRREMNREIYPKEELNCIPVKERN